MGMKLPEDISKCDQTAKGFNIANGNSKDTCRHADIRTLRPPIRPGCVGECIADPSEMMMPHRFKIYQESLRPEA